MPGDAETSVLGPQHSAVCEQDTHLGYREPDGLTDGYFRKAGGVRPDHRCATSGRSLGHHSGIDGLVPEQPPARVSAAHISLPSAVG
jgi:hypothetical protein